MQMDSGVALKRALDAAAVWHRNQLRKYPAADVPYMSHPAGVAVTLAKHGFEDDVIAAGALHDVMEDCGVTYDELANQFGVRVADLVKAVTEDDKSIAWEERKQRHQDALSVATPDVRAIAIADKIDNFRSILVVAQSGADPWAMFKRGRAVQVLYFERFIRAVAGGWAHPIVEELSDAFAAIQRGA